MHRQANYSRCKDLLRRITYKPSTGFELHNGNPIFITHWQNVADSLTGQITTHRGRKFYVSPHMTDQEVIRTCALAVKTYEEHEANEWLRFNGCRVLNPHPEGPRPDNRE